MNLESGTSTKKTKQQVLEEFNSGTPLKYALEIANVTNTEELLEKLSQFETNAGFEKVFAKLKAVRNLKDIKIAFKSLDYLGDLKDGALYNTQGQYKNSSNTITIDYTYANVGNVADFYVTVLHELFHHVFRGADIASGINILYGISDVKNTIEKLPVHNKYRHLYQTVLDNVSKEDVENYYGLSSVDEFISEAYSNPQFQAFLKSVQLQKSKSASRKTIDLLLSVVTLNARIISKEIPEKTAFEAFQNIDLNSLDLLEDFEKNVHNSKETTPHFEIPNYEQGIQFLKSKVAELEQELIRHFNGDKDTRDEFFLNNYINSYNKTVSLLETNKNINRTNFLSTEKISDVNISDKSGVFVFKVGDDHVAKQNIPIEGTLKEIEATRLITSPRIHAISEIAFMDDHFYGGMSLARGVHLTRSDKLSLSESEKKNLYSDLYELEKNNIGIDPSKHNNFYYEQGEGVHFIDLSPQRNNLKNTKVFLGFFENTKLEEYEMFKTELK